MQRCIAFDEANMAPLARIHSCEVPIAVGTGPTYDRYCAFP
jgi:hypothetical protein